LTFKAGGVFYLQLEGKMKSGEFLGNYKGGKLYCANCAHCVVFKQAVGQVGSYVLRVRCSKGMWKKRSGEEKVYKYFTIVRRTKTVCLYYDPMGEEKTFIEELRKSLPVKDEIYSF
jgi:hypothetical protein